MVHPLTLSHPVSRRADTGHLSWRALKFLLLLLRCFYLPHHRLPAPSSSAKAAGAVIERSHRTTILQTLTLTTSRSKSSSSLQPTPSLLSLTALVVSCVYGCRCREGATRSAPDYHPVQLPRGSPHLMMEESCRDEKKRYDP